MQENRTDNPTIDTSFDPNKYNIKIQNSYNSKMGNWNMTIFNTVYLKMTYEDLVEFQDDWQAIKLMIQPQKITIKSKIQNFLKTIRLMMQPREVAVKSKIRNFDVFGSVIDNFIKVLQIEEDSEPQENECGISPTTKKS